MSQMMRDPEMRKNISSMMKSMDPEMMRFFTLLALLVLHFTGFTSTFSSLALLVHVCIHILCIYALYIYIYAVLSLLDLLVQKYKYWYLRRRSMGISDASQIDLPRMLYWYKSTNTDI
jgi:hypothetical protein